MLSFINIEEQKEAKPVIAAFTDGACVGNGKAGARGAYAVVWPEYPHLDKALKLPTADGLKHTNNRAELAAVILAIDIANEHIDVDKTKTLIIYTDSQLTIKSMTEWLPKWKRSGWKKMTDGKPVANVDLLSKLDGLMKDRKVAFRHVRAHTKAITFEAVYNDKVDKLARAAV